VEETICVKPACRRTVLIPSVYGYRPKLVCDTGPNLRETVRPAVYGVVSRDVMVAPEREYWRPIQCQPATSLGPCECQVECWTKECCPPVYREEQCPVCVTPERHCVEYTPAQYRVVQERYLAQPARCEVVCDPPEYRTRRYEVCVRPGRWEWRRNPACEVPCAPPPSFVALQVEMQDSAASGEEAGIFAVGDTVRYDLVITNDEGSQQLEGVRVTFALPAELEFLSGGGTCGPVNGEGQAASSEPFGLKVGGSCKMFVLCRVLAAPASTLLELSASVKDAQGLELASETESTTVKPN
jgi:uncharacterized repeat protein (TIGR01451 family)